MKIFFTTSPTLQLFQHFSICPLKKERTGEKTKGGFFMNKIRFKSILTQ